jgi:hypothetical protein
VSILDDLVSTILTAADTGSPFTVGTVAAVSAGGAADGNALVTVTWQGTSIQVAYAASYTPVVGHVVLLARTQPLVILCRVIGTPPSS